MEQLDLFGWQTSFQNCVGSGEGQGGKSWTARKKMQHCNVLETTGTAVVIIGCKRPSLS